MASGVRPCRAVRLCPLSCVSCVSAWGQHHFKRNMRSGTHLSQRVGSLSVFLGRLNCCSFILLEEFARSANAQPSAHTQHSSKSSLKPLQTLQPWHLFTSPLTHLTATRNHLHNAALAVTCMALDCVVWLTRLQPSPVQCCSVIAVLSGFVFSRCCI